MVSEAAAALAGIAATLIVAARVFGILLFGASAAGKVTHIRDFTDAIAGYGLLPAGAHRAAALAIVACEVAVVAALAAGPFVRAGALLAVVMLLVFALAMAVVLRRGDAGVDCGCFFGGGRGARIDRSLIGRNLFFTAIILPAALWPLQPGALTAMILIDGFGFACACFLLGELVGQLARLRHVRTISIGGRP